MIGEGDAGEAGRHEPRGEPGGEEGGECGCEVPREEVSAEAVEGDENCGGAEGMCAVGEGGGPRVDGVGAVGRERE